MDNAPKMSNALSGVVRWLVCEHGWAGFAQDDDGNSGSHGNGGGHGHGN
jgi:hypothetical protein